MSYLFEKLFKRSVDDNGCCSLEWDGPAIPVEVVSPEGTTKQVTSVLLCEPDTKKPVMAIVCVDKETGDVTQSFRDITSGADYTGDTAALEVCLDEQIESDQVIMCDNGTEFIRWIVKENGEPTGTSFDTDVTGVAYTASGAEVVGKCVVELDRYDVETDAVCNTDTNVYDAITKVFINEVQDSETITPTTIPCDEEQPRFEQVRVCRAGFINIVTNQIDSDGTITEINVVVTPESCAEPVKQDVTVKDCDGNTTTVQVDSVVKVEGTISAKLCPEDAIAVDVEYVCNEDTNLYDQIVITSTNGVPAAPVITPTTISCENIDTSKDYEQVRVCDATTGTVHIITTAFTQDDVATQIGDLDTLEVCTPPEKQKVEVDTCDGTDSVLVDSEVVVRGVVTTKECPKDIVEVDTEYVCNEDTNMYDQLVIVTTNGVSALPVITGTNIPCDQDPDFETVTVCDVTTKTKHVITYQYDEDGTESVLSDVDTLEVCDPGEQFCVESQEWTYGIDNSGTRFDDVADYIITLSDGSTLSFSQDGSSNSWTPQLQEWSANIQAAADAAGLQWFVEPRFIDDTNPSNIDGTSPGPGGTPSGLPGAPSVPVAEALSSGGMSWRYVNIQICPGQPVPVSAERTSSTQGRPVPFNLTTAGAVLGPIQKFWICKVCGEAPVWYLEDGVTLATAGQIPDCYEPCGTLALTSAPPDRSCEFFFDIACDNVGEPDVDTNWVNLITRRATVCNGEQISVDYFTEDPNDPSALIDYTLIGDFVDCDTGEPIELPVPPCTEFEIVKLYSMPELSGELRNREWDLGPRPSQLMSEEDGRIIRESFDFSAATTIDSPWSGGLSVNDTNNDPSIQDAQVLDGYIVVDTPIKLRWSGGSLGYFAVELGECCGDLEFKFEGASGDGTAAPTPELDLKPGIHQIRLWNIDDYTSTARVTEYSLDGGVTWTTDNTPPGVGITNVKPVEICENIKVCEDTGAFIGLLDGQVKDPADYYDCPLSCTSTGGASSESCSDNELELTVQMGTNSNVPAGAKSVTINNITGITTINGTFQLGTGRRVDSISFGTDRGNCINEVLPAYTMSGGTWQWIATF